jgi:hypothetical protein
LLNLYLPIPRLPVDQPFDSFADATAQFVYRQGIQFDGMRFVAVLLFESGGAAIRGLDLLRRRLNNRMSSGWIAKRSMVKAFPLACWARS